MVLFDIKYATKKAEVLAQLKQQVNSAMSSR